MRGVLRALLAVAGGVGNDGDLLVLGRLGRIGSQQRDLVQVAHGHAEYVVRRFLAVAVGDLGGGSGRGNRRYLLLLHDVQPGQHVARIHAAQHGRDLLVVHQFIGVLDGLGRRAHVIARHDDQLAPQDAAGRVDLLGGLPGPRQRRHAEVGRTAGGHVAVVADLDVGLRPRALGHGHERGRAGDAGKLLLHFHSFVSRL
ncbi:hypothetical protein D9M68_744720 [compost metagenome]